MTLRQLLLIWLAAFVGCQNSQAVKFGDTTIPKEYSRFSCPQTVILWHINPNNNTIILHVTLNQYGYFGLAFSHKMDEADFNIIEVKDGNVTVTDAFSPGGHQRPLPDEQDDLTLLGYQTDQKTYIILKYSRPLKTNDTAGKDFSFFLGGSHKFSYAYRLGSPVMVFHGRQHVQFHAILNNQYHPHHEGTPHFSIQQDTKPLVHGVFLTIVWILFVDLAIFVKYQYSWRARLLMHGALMTTVFITTIISIIVIYDGDLKTPDMTSDVLSHYLLGVVVGVWVILHFSTGILQAYSLKSNKSLPNSVKLVKKIHKISGIILIILGKYNVLSGWYVQQNTIGFNATLISMAVSLTALILFIRWKNNQQKIDKNYYRKIKVMSNEKLQMLMHVPYNNPIVQACHIVIFHDKIHLIPQGLWHPGGAKLIEAVSGRQIDRFLYGLCGPELHPEVMPFKHPTDAVDLLGKPIGQLEHGQACTLSGDFFNVSEMECISNNYYYFYFISNGGSITYGSMDTCSHIGKYFTARAFGKIALFWCVFSQRLSVRKARERVLEKLKQKKTIFPSKLMHVDSVVTSIATMPSASILANASINSINIEEDITLPFIIKNDNVSESFYKRFYDTPKESIRISGPHGRGLCLDAITKGDIVIFAAGQGILPFLDLISEIFFTVAHHHEPSAVCDEYLEMSKAISGKRYHFFISVPDYKQLIMADEMNYINKMSEGTDVDTRFHIQTHNIPQQTFVGSTIPEEQKYQRPFMLKNVANLYNQLEMVYISGPTQFSYDVHKALTSINLSTERIFFV